MSQSAQDIAVKDLFDAIARNDYVEVTRLLDSGVSADARDYKDDTPLIWATVHGCDGIVKDLLKRGATPDLTDGQGDTALIYATAQGRLSIMRTLIERKANIHLAGNGGDTPLRVAIANEDGDALVILLKAGCRASDKNDQGSPALVLAAALYPKSLAILLKEKPNLYVSTAQCISPLRAAICAENEDCVEQLVAAGCDPAYEDMYMKTDLTSAFQCGNENISNMVRQATKKFELINKLARNDPPDEVLPYVGADTDYALRDCSGKTALYYAVQNYIYNERNSTTWKDVITKMINHGADLNQRMHTGQKDTPMFWLAHQFSEIFADELIAKGGRLNIADAEGQFPWDVAKKLNNLPMAAHLEMRGREEMVQVVDAARSTDQVIKRVKSISFAPKKT